VKSFGFGEGLWFGRCLMGARRARRDAVLETAALRSPDPFKIRSTRAMRPVAHSTDLSGQREKRLPRGGAPPHPNPPLAHSSNGAERERHCVGRPARRPAEMKILWLALRPQAQTHSPLPELCRGRARGLGASLHLDQPSYVFRLNTCLATPRFSAACWLSRSSECL